MNWRRLKWEEALMHSKRAGLDEGAGGVGERSIVEEKVISFNGPCPFLTCLKTEPHTHPVCSVCGAVRYGNLFCPECQKHARRQFAERMVQLWLNGLS